MTSSIAREFPMFRNISERVEDVRVHKREKIRAHKREKIRVHKRCPNTLQKTRDLEDFVEKMQITVQNVVWTVFLGVVIVAI